MNSFNWKTVSPRTGKGEAKFYSSFPGKSKFNVGLGKSVEDLKERLLKNLVSAVGVHCIGGGGKTTLAIAICDDFDIKGCFGNIVFITVSQSPNLKGIFETIWQKIVGKKVPEFQNVEDAHIQLQQQLLRQSKTTLVVLDDVWSRASLEKLLFEAPGYKTLITTRDASTIPRNASTIVYQLPLLNKEDALSLFCLSAFGQTSMPSTADANLVIEVQAECKGLPLALKVVGSSLYGEPHVAWENAKKKLSQGQSISIYHKEGLFRCLKTSIDCLDDVARKCFLDTASFPEDKKISADALLNIWVYVRKMEWQDAYIMLLELARRNLLNLISNQGSRATISYECASELFFSQHDVMRDLALYLGCQGSMVDRKRLLMPRQEHSLPGEWESCRDRQYKAQIVSIHTGSMTENEWKWNEMNLPETEALVLLFSASEYFLPPFLKTMKKLKFLMVCNLSSKRATIKGLDTLSSLTQLRSVRLERVVAPTIPKQSKVIQNLDKLSLSLCEGFVNMSTFNDTNLQELNLDHCSDLEELPLAMCHMPSAQRWSVTNCHLVEKLPYNLGSLSSIRMLRLSALPALKELPASIGKLEQLEYLDISLCEGLKDLPDEVGQLKKLKEFDMRECSRLRRLPKSVCGLSSLKHVICDEKIGNQWLKAKAISIPELRVEIVEPQFTLDWLDD
ncbi:probable disease resistance protein At4g33300 isoform X2 [Cryptomeria japonica]|uniref:probable disease resistance protein At4g33300 isoform X2 n=1 Tax=Cryptomeria japonica TaxID=3369 RepID=UPI0025ABE9E9|nr:probable disease resistance protein At4g33300 isoform X2 [Cryptomeria japonica]